jgi:hypothetical protein
MEVHRLDVIDRLTLSVLNRRMLGLGDFEERRSADETLARLERRVQ